MHWALAGEVPPPRRRGVPARRRPSEVGGRRSRSATTRRVPAHRRRRPQRRVRRVGAGARRRRARPDRRWPASSPSTTTSGIVEVLAGTFGPDLEAELRPTHGLTVGHFPQSFDIATVGGWVACRGAGQYSHPLRQDRGHGRRARGRARRRHASSAPAAPRPRPSGPTSTQLFLGSEGTLGVITRVWLRAHPAPAARAPRRVRVRHVRRRARRLPARSCGAAPRRPCCACTTASSRQRGHGGDGTECVLLVLDEGDPAIVDATMAVVAEECAGARRPRRRRARRALARPPQRHVSALQALTRKGFVVDTMEIAAPWSRAAGDLRRRRARRCSPCRTPVPPAATCRTATPTAPASTSRSPPRRRPTRSRRPTWRCGTPASAPCSPPAATCRTTTASGLNRARFVAEALGAGARRARTRSRTRSTRTGILNPGKLGLRHPFGDAAVAVSRERRLARRVTRRRRRVAARLRRAVLDRRSLGRRQRRRLGRGHAGSASAPCVGFVLGAGVAAWVQRTATCR